MKNAIEIAIEGGWKPSKYLDYGNEDQKRGLQIFVDRFAQQMALLDPLFWQCLGKAMGWYPLGADGNGNNNWLYHWHRFIDALAEGKDADSFFRELLASNTLKNESKMD